MYKYNQNIPQFLVNRPRHLVVHCMERWEVAKNIPKGHITIIDDVTGEFKVKSQLEQTVRYNLQFGDPSSMPKCECPDWLQTFLPCKHFLAIFHPSSCLAMGQFANQLQRITTIAPG